MSDKIVQADQSWNDNGVMRRGYQLLREENKALAAEVVRLVRLTDAMRATIEETQQAIRDISRYNAEQLHEARSKTNEGWVRPGFGLGVSSQ